MKDGVVKTYFNGAVTQNQIKAIVTVALMLTFCYLIIC